MLCLFGFSISLFFVFIPEIRKCLSEKKDFSFCKDQCEKGYFLFVCFTMGQKTLSIETVQDFLCKLGMKPQTHVLKRSTLVINGQMYQNYEQSRQKLGTFLEINLSLQKKEFVKIRILKCLPRLFIILLSLTMTDES